MSCLILLNHHTRNMFAPSLFLPCFSDDLFSLGYPPGKTLCIGASYVSLECAGFLAAFGFDTTVMVRSILLRGFDQQMAKLVGKYMENHSIKFKRGFVPTKIELIEEGTPRKLRVHFKEVATGEEKSEEFNTVSACASSVTHHTSSVEGNLTTLLYL